MSQQLSKRIWLRNNKFWFWKKGKKIKCDYYLPRQRIWCLIAYLSSFQGKNCTYSLESCPYLGEKQQCLHVLKYHPQTCQHLAPMFIMSQDQTAIFKFNYLITFKNHYLITAKTRKYISVYTHLNICPWTPILQKFNLDLLTTLTSTN